MLRPATFLKTLLTLLIFLRTAYLFNTLIAAIHPLNNVSVSAFYGSHPFFEGYCVAFIRCTCLLSFVIIRYHFLLFLVIRCHLFSYVVIRCHSMYHSPVFL